MKLFGVKGEKDEGASRNIIYGLMKVNSSKVSLIDRKMNYA